MGAPKQLVDWHGRPLVRAVAENALAARLDGLLVVTGGAHAEVEQALSGLALRLVHNPDFAAGQSTSLHAGVAALRRNGEATVRDALTSALAPFEQPDGCYRLENKFKFMLASP